MTAPLRVLLTNDDGFGAPGIRALCRALKEKFAVVVAAPHTQQSGISHAFTLHKPLFYREANGNGDVCGYEVAGTPSDCVKFAVSCLLPSRPDIVVSGMNIGENSGVSGYYSGTVAAAREGAFWGILSVAFSLEEAATRYLDEYCAGAAVILQGLAAACGAGADRRVFYNVNFPACAPSKCRGVKTTRQSLAFFDDRYRPAADAGAPGGFVIYGEKRDLEPSDDFDSRALLNDYVTVTPLHYDATSETTLLRLRGLERSLQAPGLGGEVGS